MTTNYDSWAEVYDVVHSYRTIDIPFYVDLAQSVGGQVLEPTCGTGRVTIPIAKAGVDILGLDLSSRMLQIARKNHKQAGELPGRLSFKHGDMRNFRMDHQFKLVIIPFNSFLLLLSVADQRRALETIHRHLVPGGKLALDIFVPDPRSLVEEDARLYLKEDVTDPVSGRQFVLWEQSRYDNHHQVIYVRTIIEELNLEGEVLRKLYRHHQSRYIHRYEMQHLLEVSGFEIEDLYGDFEGGDYDPDSAESVWLARKG